MSYFSEGLSDYKHLYNDLQCSLNIAVAYSFSLWWRKAECLYYIMQRRVIFFQQKLCCYCKGFFWTVFSEGSVFVLLCNNDKWNYFLFLLFYIFYPKVSKLICPDHNRVFRKTWESISPLMDLFCFYHFITCECCWPFIKILFKEHLFKNVPFKGFLLLSKTEILFSLTVLIKPLSPKQSAGDKAKRAVL